MASSLRIVTWNCRSGAPTRRLEQLTPYSPDLVFLQECDPAETLPFAGKMCRKTERHQRLIDTFADLGLVSAYHAFHGEEHGRETRGTYFHRFHLAEPWHIDFCFVPQAWRSQLTKVEVLDGEEWAKQSDHRPLLVEIETA